MVVRVNCPSACSGDQNQGDLPGRRGAVGRVRRHRGHHRRPQAGRLGRRGRPGSRRVSELKVPLRGVTAKSLTQSLRRLERDGFVVREEYEGTERRVEYTLTPLGLGLLGPLDAACEWTREHWDELIDAQEASLSGGSG